MKRRSTPGWGKITGWSARRRKSMTTICPRHGSAYGKTTCACRRSATSYKRQRRTLRTSCRQVRLDAPAARRVQGASPVATPGGLAQWRLRVAQPPTPGPSGRCSGGAKHKTAVLCPRAWHLRHAPAQALVGASRTAGEPSPPWTLPGARRLALQDPAHMQSAEDRRAGADGGAAAAEPSVDGDSTQHRVRWGHDVPPYGRRLVVSRCRPGAGLACRGRVVHGCPHAGRVGQPSVGAGTLSAAARSGTPHADGPWQAVWRGQLSAAPATARNAAEDEAEGQLWGERRGGELLSYLQDCIDLYGGLGHTRGSP